MEDQQVRSLDLSQKHFYGGSSTGTALELSHAIAWALFPRSGGGPKNLGLHVTRPSCVSVGFSRSTLPGSVVLPPLAGRDSAVDLGKGR